MFTTVYDFQFYCTEAQFCRVCLFDNDIGEDVFIGNLSDVPEKYLDYNVQSFDPVEGDLLTLNIGVE